MVSVMVVRKLEGSVRIGTKREIHDAKIGGNYVKK